VRLATTVCVCQSITEQEGPRKQKNDQSSSTLRRCCRISSLLGADVMLLVFVAHQRSISCAGHARNGSRSWWCLSRHAIQSCLFCHTTFLLTLLSSLMLRLFCRHR
ncbi:unnamed protein product, partial [Scytosiphon promiscuus]